MVGSVEGAIVADTLDFQMPYEILDNGCAGTVTDGSDRRRRSRVRRSIRLDDSCGGELSGTATVTRLNRPSRGAPRPAPGRVPTLPPLLRSNRVQDGTRSAEEEPAGAQTDMTTPQGDLRDARLATEGDARAFERLYRKHVPRVHGLARRMVGHEEADELTQDVFVRAWERLETFRGEAAFGTWIHRVAINVMLARQEVRKRDRGRFEDDDAQVDATPGTPTGSGIQDRRGGGAEESSGRGAQGVRPSRHGRVQAPRDRGDAGHHDGNFEVAAPPRAHADAGTTGRLRDTMNAHPIEQLSEYLDDELSLGERPGSKLICPNARSAPVWWTTFAQSWPRLSPSRTRRPPRTCGRPLRAVWSPAAEARESCPSTRAAARAASRSRCPQLAAASIAIALLSAGAVWMAIRDGGGTLGPTASAPRSEEPITGAVEEPLSGAGGETAPAVTVADRGAPVESAEYEAAVAELERLLDQAAIDPELRKAIDENLAVIDDAIRQTRQALEEDPDDVYLNTHLASTMQRKIDVLQDAARLARAST